MSTNFDKIIEHLSKLHHINAFVIISTEISTDFVNKMSDEEVYEVHEFINEFQDTLDELRDKWDFLNEESNL